MHTPAPQSAEERGKHWLQAQVQQILADHGVALAPLGADGAPACAWGTGPETGTTLYLRLADDPEPKPLPFRRTMIMDCGAGRYTSQHNAILGMRRTLKKLGILPA